MPTVLSSSRKKEGTKESLRCQPVLLSDLKQLQYLRDLAFREMELSSTRKHLYESTYSRMPQETSFSTSNPHIISHNPHGRQQDHLLEAKELRLRMMLGSRPRVK